MHEIHTYIGIHIWVKINSLKQKKKDQGNKILTLWRINKLLCLWPNWWKKKTQIVRSHEDIKTVTGKYHIILCLSNVESVDRMSNSRRHVWILWQAYQKCLPIFKRLFCVGPILNFVHFANSNLVNYINWFLSSTSIYISVMNSIHPWHSIDLFGSYNKIAQIKWLK